MNSVQMIPFITEHENLKLASESNILNWIENIQFWGIRIININDFSELLVRLVLNTFIIFLIIQFIYAKSSKRKDFYFSFLGVSSVVFLLCFLLNNVKLELGFAMGLFAIFGIIRYRTDTIPIKEMTYLFIVIGISVINALATKKVSYSELILANSAIFIGLWLLEKRLILKQESCINLTYGNLENIHVNKKAELLADLKKKTGIDIKRYHIMKIDLQKKNAEIKLYFNANGQSDINLN